MPVYLDAQDREMVCDEHLDPIAGIEWGPLVNGLPDTWVRILFECGCVVHPDDLAPCCPVGTGCRSRRLLDRLRTWRDNSAWHHRHVANGPLWWTCGDCRALRRPEWLQNASLRQRVLHYLGWWP